MSKLEQISVAVSPETAALLHAAVKGGGFGSTDEVVRVALEEWSQRRVAQGEATEQLGRLWDEGVASGPMREAEASFARIRDNLRAKLATERR